MPWYKERHLGVAKTLREAWNTLPTCGILMPRDMQDCRLYPRVCTKSNHTAVHICDSYIHATNTQAGMCAGLPSCILPYPQAPATSSQGLCTEGTHRAHVCSAGMHTAGNRCGAHTGTPVCISICKVQRLGEAPACTGRCKCNAHGVGDDKCFSLRGPGAP